MAATGGIVAVGVDGSDDSDHALRFATAEAVRRRAALRIICAYDLPAFTWTSGVDVPADMMRQIAVAARTVAADAATRARELSDQPDLVVDAVAVPGRASQVLISHSADVEVLVVGSRRLGGAGRLFLGSVSTELIHHAAVPVVVVPTPLDR